MPGPVNGPRDAAKAHESYMAEGQKELDRRLSKMKDDRYAAMNKRVEEENAKKKAVADVKAFSSKSKKEGTVLGRLGGQKGAMQRVEKSKAAQKVANDKSDVAMSKRSAPPANPVAKSKAPATSTVKPPPPRPKDLGSSSPKPPPPRPAGLGAKPPPRPKKFKVGGTVNSRGNKGAVSGKKFSGTY